jgi:hypothetical protein
VALIRTNRGTAGKALVAASAGRLFPGPAPKERPPVTVRAALAELVGLAADLRRADDAAAAGLARVVEVAAAVAALDDAFPGMLPKLVRVVNDFAGEHA